MPRFMRAALEVGLGAWLSRRPGLEHCHGVMASNTHRTGGLICFCSWGLVLHGGVAYQTVSVDCRPAMWGLRHGECLCARNVCSWERDAVRGRVNAVIACSSVLPRIGGSCWCPWRLGLARVAAGGGMGERAPLRGVYGRAGPRSAMPGSSTGKASVLLSTSLFPVGTWLAPIKRRIRFWVRHP